MQDQTLPTHRTILYKCWSICLILWNLGSEARMLAALFSVRYFRFRPQRCSRLHVLCSSTPDSCHWPVLNRAITSAGAYGLNRTKSLPARPREFRRGFIRELPRDSQWSPPPLTEYDSLLESWAILSVHGKVASRGAQQSRGFDSSRRAGVWRLLDGSTSMQGRKKVRFHEVRDEGECERSE